MMMSGLTPGGSCREAPKPRAKVMVDGVTLSSLNNFVLLDVRVYRRERSLMSHPKDWSHVLRRVQEVAPANPWNADPVEIEQALSVLGRLSRLEKKGQGK
jgi:hypothetical protein